MEQAKKFLNTINLESDTLYDLIYDLIFFNALKESEDDIKNGRVITLDELAKEMEAMYERYNNKQST
ncbi:MAG: hypothetical protein ACI4U9_04000 [Clostridia bacterium]